MTKEDLPGTALKDPKDVPHVAYEPDLRYAWDNGLALTTYLDGFKKGKIRGSRCGQCGRMMIPARSFCELCNLHNVSEYFDLPDTGVVETFTLSHVDWDSSMLPDGQVNIFAVIAMDGASPQMGLVHMLGDVKPEEVHVGMRVKAVWKPEAEREGTVTDVIHFKPLADDAEVDGTISLVKPVELDSITAQPFPGRIPMSYVYTAGIGGIKFYSDLAEGKLSGTWCDHCEAVHLPPAGFCEFAMETLDPEADSQAVDPASGKIAAFTVLHEDRSGELLDEPQVVIQVVFPDTVGTVFGKLQVKAGDSVGIGMPVKLVKAPLNSGPEEVWFKSLV